MPAIIIRESKPRINPKDPTAHPGYARAVAAGKSRLGKMEFENAAQRADYERSVRANPNNVMGLPNFYPPEELKSFMNDIKQQPDPNEDRKRQYFAMRELIQHEKDIELWCEGCKQETVHCVMKPEFHDGMRSFCRKCGRQNVFHL
jgi:hypothetical protein